MESRLFEQFSKIIYRESGIKLGNDKVQLLANRIQKRLRTLGLSDAKKYLEIVEADLSGEEMTQLLDAISTNVTYFYREPKHFEILATVLQELRAAGRSEIKIWCAASSSGEEPFTIAMTAAKTLPLATLPVKILATDISTKVLKRATDGIYDERVVSKIPAEDRQRFFEPCDAGWQVSPELRKLVNFKVLNLAKHPLPLSGPIDIIFCRNVMIYFDLDLRSQLISEFQRLLCVGGHLFLSHSENLLGIDHKLRTREVAVFQKAVR